MSDPMPVLMIGILLLLPFFLMASLSYDRLIRRLYDLHRKEWRTMGSPPGFFWRPPEKLPASSLPAFVKCTMTWPFRLPPSLAGEPDVRRTYLMMRIGLLVWNVGLLTLFVFILRTFPMPLG